ncbi:MAG: 50S ribosomal protein L4 [bacterium]
METKIYNMQGKAIEVLSLDEDVFGDKIISSVLREAMLAYSTSHRQGTASTKSRAQVKGGGRKPWIQKGTGRARAGSIRSPLWVGGGIIFGPKPRSFRYPLPQKIKKIALKSSLRKKLKEGGLIILDQISIKNGKTKEMVGFLQSLSIKGKTLLVLEQVDEKVIRSASNLKNLRLSSPFCLSAYDVLSHKNVCITKGALLQIRERLREK